MLLRRASLYCLNATFKAVGFNKMPDVSLSSLLLLNTLSIRVDDCSANLVGRVIFRKNPTVIKLSKQSLKCLFLIIFNKSML